MGLLRCPAHTRAIAVVTLLLTVACTSPAEVVAHDDGSTSGPTLRPSVVAVAPNAAPSGPFDSVAPQPPRPDAALRGDERGWFAKGATLTVFGLHTQLVAYEQPGPFQPVVSYLYAADDHTATGRAREAADALWVEVELGDDGTTGWVDRRFVGVRGATDDLGAEVPAGARSPVGVDVLDLGTKVMRGLGYDPEGVGTTLSQAPVVKRKATVAFDVRLADDAILGERVRVIGVPVDATEGRFELERVERTWICARGTTDDRACR